ncbi:N-acetylglucosamine kinase [Cohnella silvisoli]|uniref:BadF/BadG/BcrA/BcrD ATPase family protein n=1 Tax=Cohnella silvisoli TaxID=2873699 RepID=A0ABV1L0R1_9BACL|nr:BadF/BadG/BcrA/BcrD ATPase family protein [Cohnella silvisoli]MCD9024986.1 ATPase [Cohnella silvisoli]
MNYYLGVDGGGSKTLAVVSDSAGRIVGRGESGCGNHQLGVDLANRNIREAVAMALLQAKVEQTEIEFAMFGLAGADREADFQILRPMIANIGFNKHSIVCDTVIGLRAGTKQQDGVVMICGSGTNCYGINKRGEAFQCGGFGYAFGDFGGGSELAVEVFRSVIRSWEGRERNTLLTQATLRTLGFASVEQMFHAYLDEGVRVPHYLAKLLFEVAGEDEVARGILRRQGIELGLAASAVIRKLGMQHDKFDLVMVGSVLTRGDSEYLTPYIQKEVSGIAPDCNMRILTMEPVAGAILLAMEQSGSNVDNSVYEHLEERLSVKEIKTAWAID